MKGFFIVFLLVLLSRSSIAAPDSTTRATWDGHKGGVGLVLSGGGAKGLYHVGLIKALEENDIPIDYVTGASMGAIVGALYASGWSPERMWNFFLTDSVSGWLTGKIPEKYHGYYRRFDPRPEMVGINLNTDSTKNKNILQLPTNIISPHMLDLAFVDILAPASAAASNHFDSLMIPFRCVATDIFNNNLVVFKDGSLQFAVRASMTIPLVFKPLVRQDTLLYDGGVLNNFPWQPLADDFDPSNYIGGVCTDNFSNPDQNDIIGQVLVMVARPTNYLLPDSTRDIKVGRMLKDIGVLEYDKAGIIMQRGYEDAMKMMPQIKEKITRRTTKAEIEKKRNQFLSIVPELVFDSIEISGLTKLQESYVRRQLGLHLHRNFDYKYFNDKYLRILSAEVFTGEFPVITYNPLTGFYRIKLTMSTKPSFRFSLGGNISSSSLTEGYVGVAFRHTTSISSSYGLDLSFGMFRNSLSVIGRHDFYTNFPFYIDYSFGLDDMAYDGSNQTPYYRNKDWRFKKQQGMYFSTSVSIPVLNNSAFRGRLSLGRNFYNYFSQLHNSADVVTESRFEHLEISAEVETSTINYALYGTEGAQQMFSLRYVLGLESLLSGTTTPAESFSGANRWWFEMRYRREQYVPLAKWFTLGYLLDATITNQPTFGTTMADKLLAPRFEPTPQMRTLFMTEFASPSYVGVGIIPTFNILKNKLFYLKLYAMAFVPQELVLQDNTWYAPEPKRWVEWTEFIFGGSLVYQTPIGPASITVAKYSTGPGNWNFQFNFGYLLFKNRRF